MLNDAFFQSSEVHKRTVTLAGKEHDLYFQRISAYDQSRFFSYWNSKDANERAEAAFVMVAASLCEASGAPAITVEKARTLKPEALNELFAKAMEVNKREEPEGNA